MIDWIDRAEDQGDAIYNRVARGHKRLKKNKYTKKGILISAPSEERAVPIIEEIITKFIR